MYDKTLTLCIKKFNFMIFEKLLQMKVVRALFFSILSIFSSVPRDSLKGSFEYKLECLQVHAGSHYMWHCLHLSNNSLIGRLNRPPI